MFFSWSGHRSHQCEQAKSNSAASKGDLARAQQLSWCRIASDTTIHKQRLAVNMNAPGLQICAEGGRGKEEGGFDGHTHYNHTQHEQNEGGERGEGGARRKNRVHPTSARLCSSHATMSCCCVRSGGGWLSCASMSMPMRGNVIHGTSCHHHHDDELNVCQCVLQTSHPCVCVCVQRAHQCRQQHTPKKEKKRGESACVCVRRERGKQPAK